MVEAHIVEDEEFCFGAKEGGVANARRLHVFDGLDGNGAGAAGIQFACARLFDGADHAQGGVRHEGVDPGGVGIGHHHHVRFVNGLPAPDAGTIECHAIGKAALVDLALVQGEMLPNPWHVDEFQIN